MTEDNGPQQALDDMRADQVTLMTLLADSAPASEVFAVAETLARRASSDSKGGSLREQTLRVKDLLDRRRDGIATCPRSSTPRRTWRHGSI